MYNKLDFGYGLCYLDKAKKAPYAMNKAYLPLTLALALLYSCGGDDPSQLSPNLVTEVKAYDLDNNGDASDIRVDFGVVNNLNVREYRIIALASNEINAFDINVATAIPSTSYQAVEPQSFELAYSVTRLDPGLLSAVGSPVQNDIEYVLVILTEGAGSFQLSEFSNPFTLKDQGIYNGLYFIGSETTWTMIDNSTVVRNFAASGNFRVDLILAGNEYSGTIQCLDCVNPLFETQGRMKFSVNATVVQNFTRVWPNQPCWFESLCDSPSDPCPVLNTGQGSVVEDLVFVLFMTGDDCISSSNWKYTLIRQL